MLDFLKKTTIINFSSILFCDASDFWQLRLQDPASSIMERTLLFNPHLLFIVIMIVIFTGLLLFNTIYSYNELNSSRPANFFHSNDLRNCKGFFKNLETNKRVILFTNTHMRFFASVVNTLLSWRIPFFCLKIDACPRKFYKVNLFIKNLFNNAFRFLKNVTGLVGVVDANSLAELSKGDPLAATVIVISGAVVIFVTRLMADRARNNVTPEPMEEETPEEGGENNNRPGPLPSGEEDNRSFDAPTIFRWPRDEDREDADWFEWLFGHFENDGMWEFVQVATHFAGEGSITVTALRTLIRRIWFSASGSESANAAGILNNIDLNAFNELPLLAGYPLLAGFVCILVRQGVVGDVDQGLLLVRFFVNYALQRSAAREGVAPAGFMPEKDPFSGFE